MAGIPSLLPLCEYAVRAFRGTTQAGFFVRWPFFIGCFLGFILLVGSFLDSPPGQLNAKWELGRLVHVVSWATSLIVSVGLVLDV